MSQRHESFLWYELMTSDPKAAEAFYRSVVGWETADAGQPHLHYTIVSAGTRGVGGITTLPAEARSAGAKPGWLGYVRVDDTDAAAKRIAQSGGSIQRLPDDIPEVGRFAVVADPGGAVFMLLTPLPREEGLAPVGPSTPGHVGWHELYARNGQDAAFGFYSGHFGWNTVELLDMGPMGKYRIFAAGGEPIGGMMDKPSDVPLSAWAYYFNVDGIDAAIERIRRHGGQILMGPHEVPGGSWIVQALDPQGASFALVSPTR
jgi:hypothetical protein